MDFSEVSFEGETIRITPDGLVNITDVAKALGKSRSQWAMEKRNNADIYEGSVGTYRFHKHSPGADVVDLETLKLYLDRTEINHERAARVMRIVKSYVTENVQLVEAEDILAQTKAFLAKLNSIPTELAEEFVELKKKVDAAV